jgi:hypothetical protein
MFVITNQGILYSKESRQACFQRTKVVTQVVLNISNLLLAPLEAFKIITGSENRTLWPLFVCISKLASTDTEELAFIWNKRITSILPCAGGMFSHQLELEQKQANQSLDS